MSNAVTPYPIDCFEKIIGLSENDCECNDENTGYNESLSGIYLDKAEGLQLNTIDSIKDCSNENNLWGLMNSAKLNAIRQFIADSNSALIQKYIPARSNYYGSIGRIDYKRDRVISHTYAGVCMETANIAGGYAHIKTITTCFAGAGNRTLKIYNNLNEQIGVDIPLVIANGRVVNTVDITLPLWDKRIDNLQYFFVYTVDPAIPCKDTVLHCNCGGVHYNFDTNKPYYKSHNNKLEGWAKWFMIGSFASDNFQFEHLTGLAESYTNGLSFGIDLYCDLGMQFCFEQPDTKSNSFLTLAFAIQHYAAYLLIMSILTSTNVSRYTMLGGEQLQALMTIHETKYKECLKWLIDNANTHNTDCLACRDNIKMGVGSL